jgi:hypothetical protein
MKSALLTIVIDEDADFHGNGNSFSYYMTVNVVPEPSSFILLLVSLISLIAYSWKRQKRSKG